MFPGDCHHLASYPECKRRQGGCAGESPRSVDLLIRTGDERVVASGYGEGECADVAASVGKYGDSGVVEF
jgi:hypothetical protein